MLDRQGGSEEVDRGGEQRSDQESPHGESQADVDTYIPVSWITPSCRAHVIESGPVDDYCILGSLEPI